MTDYMNHKAADAAVHAGDPHTTGVVILTNPPVIEPSVGDHIQARLKAEDRIHTALTHIDKDLDTVAMNEWPGLFNETIRGMLTDLKEILTKP